MQTLPDATAYWVAFSGGMDSQVLLHALAAIRAPLGAPLGAVHVHHGLQDEADAWDAHCERVARELDCDYVLLPVTVERTHTEGLEAAAREARYQALRDWLPSGAALLTAHHQRDQAETLLLQLLRGSGPKGLAGMPFSQAFGRGQLLRPWLDTPYARLQAYAEQAGLAWIEDPSNASVAFARNRLRHELMPAIREFWPALDGVLARSARHQATASHLLDDLAEIDFVPCQVKPEDSLNLSVTALLDLSAERRDNVLRFWIHRQGFRLPSEKLLRRITPELLQARADAEPRITWPGAELRRYRDQLSLMPPLPAVPAGWQVPLPESPAALPAGGSLRPQTRSGQGVALALLARGSWRLGYRRGGERLRPLGAAHTRSLKQLFQEAGVPPWLRDRMPLVYCDTELVAVADRWVAAEFAARADAEGRLFHWEFPASADC